MDEGSTCPAEGTACAEILRQAEAQLISGHAMGQAEPVGIYEELDHTGPGVGGNKTQERFLEEVS